MIFLSAQPDDYYFLWQLQMQLFNFNRLGIKPDAIHVLVGYNPSKGLNKAVKEYIQTCEFGNFYAYPDNRDSKQYRSSIRPHIIAQHFAKFPSLEKESIFYHDSDILLKEIPYFEGLDKGDVWYASDTRSYLDCDYIKNAVGKEIFHEMCGIVGISPAVVEANSGGAGGAQYLLKSCTREFWIKVEKDCECMFQFLNKYDGGSNFFNTNMVYQIQAWCTDMWVVWWNALLNGKRFEIHSELDFCWADSPISAWESCKILHYTGSVSKSEKTIFRKTNYINYPPFFDDFSAIDNSTCSGIVKQVIGDYKLSQLNKRIDLKDVSFLIRVRIDSEDRLDNVYAVVNYIHWYFDTNILLLEVDSSPKMDRQLLLGKVDYFFVEDLRLKLSHTKYMNWLIKKAETNFICIQDADAILPLNQIQEAVNLLRVGYAMVSPYDGDFVGVDRLFKAMFIKLNNPDLFTSNKGKFAIGTRRSYGGANFINRKNYIKAGMENEYLTSWGPDDIERVKRMQVLGYKVKRVKGQLYHLPHVVRENSTYNSNEEQANLLGEYLKICSMRKNELEAYIKTWEWGVDPLVQFNGELQ